MEAYLMSPRLRNLLPWILVKYFKKKLEGQIFIDNCKKNNKKSV